MEHFTLSILICHLLSRKDSLDKLLSSLHAQTAGKSVEVLVSGDNGEVSIGKKRNQLLYSAKGRYVSYVDDDDTVSDDYVDSILTATQSDPDCIGIEGKLDSNMGVFTFRHSIQFQGWYTGADAFYRTPNHLNPIKKSIAGRIGFPDRMFGEDQLFSQALRRMLRTEVYIDHPIYFYKKEFPTT